jgi:hypothetical protein
MEFHRRTLENFESGFHFSKANIGVVFETLPGRQEIHLYRLELPSFSLPFFLLTFRMSKSHVHRFPFISFRSGVVIIIAIVVTLNLALILCSGNGSLFGTTTVNTPEPRLLEVNEDEELKFMEQYDFPYIHQTWKPPSKICMFILSGNSTRTRLFFERNFRKQYQWSYYYKLISIFAPNDFVDEKKDFNSIRTTTSYQTLMLETNVTHDHLYTKVWKATSISRDCDMFVKIDDDVWLNHSLFHYLLNEIYVTMRLKNPFFGGFWRNEVHPVLLFPTGALYALDHSLFADLASVDAEGPIFDEVEIALQLRSRNLSISLYDKFEYYFGKGYRHAYQRGCRWLILHVMKERPWKELSDWNVCKRVGTIPV